MSKLMKKLLVNTKARNNKKVQKAAFESAVSFGPWN
jgi:hypothetical protein